MDNETAKYKIGDCFYEKRQTYKYHIVAIFISEPDTEPQIVYKYYGKHKQWWHYEVKSVYEFESWLECGLYYFK